jgi:hypothetical protein
VAGGGGWLTWFENLEPRESFWLMEAEQGTAGCYGRATSLREPSSSAMMRYMTSMGVQNEEFLWIVYSLPEKCILNGMTGRQVEEAAQLGQEDAEEERKMWKRQLVLEQDSLDRKIVLHNWTR